MKPLALWPLQDRRQLAGVLTDIDDTLTTEGAITSEALAALSDLKAAGLPVFAITGRPVGWSEPFALAWPVDAIVAENGAVALVREGHALRKLYLQDEATRRENFERLQQVARRIVREVPGATLAQDSAGRETDIAIDHSEFTQLAPAQIDAVMALMRAEGLHATVSSIHINGWYGDHDKPTGARWILKERLGIDLDAQRDRWAYVGDSSNDERMFRELPQTVGVANIARFAPHMQHLPAWVTPSERGTGFSEMARAILKARA